MKVDASVAWAYEPVVLLVVRLPEPSSYSVVVPSAAVSLPELSTLNCTVAPVWLVYVPVAWPKAGFYELASAATLPEVVLTV